VFQLFGMNHALIVKVNESCNTGHGCLGGSAYFFSEVLLREELELLWDTGGRFFFGVFTRVEAQGRRKATTPSFYCILCMDNSYYFSKACASHDYYLDIFCDQVHISHDYNTFVSSLASLRHLLPQSWQGLLQLQRPP
jgi:hypothetical protein